MNQYEAMFLFDPTFAASFENCEAEIRRVLERGSAEIVFCRKWDERRLAFKIKGRKRGLYVLTYFKAPAEKISSLERDCQISEHILRVLVLRADDITLEMMEKAIATRGADSTERDGARRRDPASSEGIPDLANAAFDFDLDDHRRDRGDRGGRRGGRKPAAV